MKQSTYIISTIVAFGIGIIIFMWGQWASYALPLPINKPANLTYMRVDNYEKSTVKFISNKDDLVAIAEILNNDVKSTESSEAKDKEKQYVIMLTDGSKTYTYTLAGQYISCEGHWFKYEGDAIQKLREIYGKLNYDEKALVK